MKNDVKELREAVANSPENIALRMSLALRLLKLKEYDECEKNYQAVLKLDKDNIKAKQGLLELYFAKQNYSAVIVIAEELAQRNIISEKSMELHIKSLIRQNNLKDAQEIYNKLLDRNPFFFDEEIEMVLTDEDDEGDGTIDFNDEFEGFSNIGEMPIPDFIENPKMMLMPPVGEGFSDIIGCENLKNELNHIYFLDELSDEDKKKYKIKNCKSLMLYGPPGCGKSYSVSCISAEFDEDIMPVDLSKTSDENHTVKKDYLIPFYFNMVRVAAPLTLYFDHFDNLVSYGEESNLLFSTQFETEMDQVYRMNVDLILLASTNKPWKIKPEWLRYGRFDDSIFVTPPDVNDRKSFFEEKSKDLNFKWDVDQLAEMTANYSYADLTYVTEKVVYNNVVQHFSKSKMPIVTTDKLVTEIANTKSSILYWFDDFKLQTNHAFKKTVIYDQIEDYIIKHNL
jgi:transitional endoplasmic reticulum ATPase